MKVLFFSPFAAIKRHEEPLLGLAEKLNFFGVDTLVMRCSSDFESYCISMSAFGLKFESEKSDKEKVCSRCIKTKLYVDFYHHQPAIEIGEYITTENNSKVKEIVERVTPLNWWDFEVDNLKIGRISAYEFYLHNKLNTREIPDHLWGEFLVHLQYTLTVFFAAIELFTREKIDTVVVYNRLYSVNKIFCVVAESFGVTTYTVEAAGYVNNLYSRYSLFKQDSTILELNNSSAWDAAKRQPLSKDQILDVGKHFEALFQANSPWVYSDPRTSRTAEELRTVVRARPGSKVILLAMSSMDEIFAADMIGVSKSNLIESIDKIFTNQLDWILHVIDIVKKYPELHLIVRIHPREMPNKRENISSQHAAEFYDILSSVNLPSNVYLNTPEEPISFYDLLRITEVVLNGNSISGLEASLLGVPVVIHHPDLLTNMPENFAFRVYSRSDYETVLLSALEAGVPPVSISEIFRWYNFRFSAVSADFISSGLKNAMRTTRYFEKINSRFAVPLFSSVRKLFFANKVTGPNGEDSEEIQVLIRGYEGIGLIPGKKKYGLGDKVTEENEIKVVLKRLKQPIDKTVQKAIK